MILIYRYLRKNSWSASPRMIENFNSQSWTSRSLEAWWKYWIWLQEGSELANKKCFSHHYARRFLNPSCSQRREWKFISQWNFHSNVSVRQLFCPLYRRRFHSENAKNQKMIQMTGIKNERNPFQSRKEKRKRKTIIIYVPNEFELDW
jgi:hypothetical protein